MMPPDFFCHRIVSKILSAFQSSPDNENKKGDDESDGFMVIKMILIIMVMMMVATIRMRWEPITAGVVMFVVIMIRMIVMMVVTVLVMLPLEDVKP